MTVKLCKGTAVYASLVLSVLYKMCADFWVLALPVEGRV